MFLLRMGINRDEIDYFIDNLSMLINSGMDIVAALNAIKTDIRSKSMVKLIDYMKEEIDEGSTLSGAIRKMKFLPEHVISLIQIGEDTGNLAENLKLIVEQEQKERVFRSKLRSAMMYPLFVVFVTVVVGVGISWFILPKLSTVFDQLKMDLPLITRALVGVGNFLSDYGVIAVPAFFLVMAIIMFFMFFFKKTKFIGQAILLRIPGVKKLIQQIELARFGYIFGTLLEAGLPIMYALDSIKDITTLEPYKNLYNHIRGEIKEGVTFEESFKKYPDSTKLLSTSAEQMIVSGEKSGNLSGTLMDIGKAFESKIDMTAKNLTTMLEPILLIIVWIGVLAIALAVILPIYSLIGNFNT